MIIISWKDISMENLFGADVLYDLSSVFVTGSILRVIYGMRLIGFNYNKLLIQTSSCFSYNFPLLLIRLCGSWPTLPGLFSMEYFREIETCHPCYSQHYHGSHFCLTSCCCLEGCLWKEFSCCGNFSILDPEYH